MSVATVALPIAAAAVTSTLPPRKTSFSLRVLHWSFYVMVTGTVVAVAALAAAIIFKLSIVFAVAFGVLAATHLIGSIVVYRFSALQGLDEEVNRLKLELQQQRANVQNLDSANTDLAKTTEQLQTQIKEREKALTDGSAKINTQADEINRISTKLQQTEEQLEKTVRISSEKVTQERQLLQQGVNTIVKETALLATATRNLATERAPFKDAVNKLATQATKTATTLNEETSRFQGAVGQVDGQVNTLKSMHNTAVQAASTLHEDTEMLAHTASQVQVASQQLKDSVGPLQTEHQRQLSHMVTMEKLKTALGNERWSKLK